MGNPASNTEEVFLEFVGQKVIGILLAEDFGSNLQQNVLIFEDGRGVGWYDSGAFRVVRADDVRMAVARRRQAAEKTRDMAQRMLDLAGNLPDADQSKPTKGRKKSAAKSR